MDNRTYFEKRAGEESRAAELAEDPAVREVHLELARRYRERASGPLLGASAAQMIVAQMQISLDPPISNIVHLPRQQVERVKGIEPSS